MVLRFSSLGCMKTSLAEWRDQGKVRKLFKGIDGIRLVAWPTDLNDRLELLQFAAYFEDLIPDVTPALVQARPAPWWRRG